MRVLMLSPDAQMIDRRIIQEAATLQVAGHKVTLLSGASVTGMVEANCDLFGENEVGRFSTFFDQIRSVHFER